MAYEMKDIPVLTGKAAERFMKQMELDEKRRGSIDFTAQLEKARNILKFSGFYNI